MSAYIFKKSPSFWDDSCHKWPCSETRRLDHWFNSISEVRLSAQDFEKCQEFARAEHRESRGYRELKVSKRPGVYVHEVGYIGQCAFAYWSGLPFVRTSGSFRNADFPQCNVDVRTRTEGWHDLKVRPDDQDDRRMVLAIFLGYKWPVRLVGWVLAIEGKKYPTDDWGKADKPVHAVPQEKLISMPDLKALL